MLPLSVIFAWLKYRVALNPQVLGAVVGIALAAVAAVGVGTAIKGVVNGIRAGEQLRILRERVLTQRAAAARIEQANRLAAEAAERERQTAAAAAEARARVESLESALREMQDDPEVWPHPLVKELRK